MKIFIVNPMISSVNNSTNKLQSKNVSSTTEPVANLVSYNHIPQNTSKCKSNEAVSSRKKSVKPYFFNTLAQFTIFAKTRDNNGVLERARLPNMKE